MHQTRAAVLWAVLTQERPTVRSVMTAARLASTSTAHVHLRALRDAGWIEWTPGEQGTIRPKCGLVVAPRRKRRRPA